MPVDDLAHPRARRWWQGRTLRARLTAWYAVAFGVGLTLVAAASLITLQLVLEDRADRYLRAAWRAFSTELLVEAAEFSDDDKAIAQTQREVRFEDVHFEVAPFEHAKTPGDARRERADDAPDAPASIALELTTRSDTGARRADASWGEKRLAEGRVVFHGREWSVIAILPLSPLHETITSVRFAYALMLPLVLGIALFGGYVAAGRALAPVTAMGRRARAIEASTLHDRLPVENPGDELGELAGVINALLARLEAAFAQQRRLVADASHELRTPVAVLLAEADVLLAREGRSESEYLARISVMRDATLRLTRLVEDLFLLSRADSGHLVARREPLYLADVASDAVRTLQGVAVQRGVQLDFALTPPWSDAVEGAPMEGDPALLDRMMLNLLDNAIKHAPANTTVHVTIGLETAHRERDGSAGNSQYVLRVADAGRGIPVEAQPFVFDRFFRVDEARTRAQGEDPRRDGAGLGLAIARWVAEVHGGRLDIECSSASGTTFRFVLPSDADDSTPPITVASGS